MSNLYATWTHPHNTTNVKDESAATVAATRVLPLHRPHFAIRAAKGPVNTIDWYTGSEAIKTFGEETFTNGSKYFGNEQLFLQEALFPNQGGFITRLADPNATKASHVLELHVTEGVDVPQYRRDEDGSYIYDEEGARVPLLGPDGAQLTNPGISVRMTSRILESDETYDSLSRRTVQVGDEITHVYPFVGVQYESVGEWGNRSGYKFYCDYRDSKDDDLVQTLGAVYYTFAPVEKPYLSDTPSYLETVYGSTYVKFMVKPDAYDADTSRKMTAKDTLFRLYTEADSEKSLLPFKVHVYEDMMNEVMALVQKVETDSVELNTSMYMANVCSFTDTNGNPYANVLVETDDETVPTSSVYVHYLNGGDDGDLSRESFEELYRQFLDCKLVPELQDRLHYPITHLYNVGYGTQTAYAQLDFLTTQPNCKVTSTPQIASRDLYTMDEAISAGTALATRATLTPESELYGTQACRAEIFLQAGYLQNKNYSQVVPLSFWMLVKRAELHNAYYIKGDLGPDPANRVTQFRKINFVPYSMEQKEICWKNSFNYCEYGRLDRLFFAGCQSVYKNKTSLLADIQFTDAVIYLKYIIDWTWADTANARLPISSLSQLVTTKIRAAAGTAFGSRYTLTECSFYQTDEEALLGTTFHVRCVLMGDSTNLIWNSDIIVRRSNYTAEAA